MNSWFLAAALVACALSGQAQIHTQRLDYKEGETPLEGFLAFDSALKGKRPAVLIVHAWKGLGEYEEKRAQMLAGLGFNASELFPPAASARLPPCV